MKEKGQERKRKKKQKEGSGAEQQQSNRAIRPKTPHKAQPFCFSIPIISMLVDAHPWIEVLYPRCPPPLLFFLHTWVR